MFKEYVAQWHLYLAANGAMNASSAAVSPLRSASRIDCGMIWSNTDAGRVATSHTGTPHDALQNAAGAAALKLRATPGTRGECDHKES